MSMAWLGIGAQRSGTTWFVDLLCQSPDVDVPGRKELHKLYLNLYPFTGSWRAQDYKALFKQRRGATLLGEFTPYYLRAPWAAGAAAEVLNPETPVIVILRDPVNRFESALRHSLRVDGSLPDRIKQRLVRALQGEARQLRFVFSDALWAGMYGRQLGVWSRVLGAERLMVLQYEFLVDYPQDVVESVWERIGARSVPLKDVRTPSRQTTISSTWRVDNVPGLREMLIDLYRPDVEDVVAQWGLERPLWPNFA